MTGHHNKLGYIYVAHSSLSGLYKIGLSLKPRDRIYRERRKLKDETISLCLQIKTDNMKKLEEYLHRQFRFHRRHGEWFALCDLDLAQISLVTDFDVVDDKSIRVSTPPIRKDTCLVKLSEGVITEMETNRLTGEVAVIVSPPNSTIPIDSKTVLILGKRVRTKITETGAMVVVSEGETFLVSRNKLRLTNEL